MGGGDKTSSSSSTCSSDLLKHTQPDLSEDSELDDDNNRTHHPGSGGSVDVVQRRKNRAYHQVLDKYDHDFNRRQQYLEPAKSNILSYFPGAWTEKHNGNLLDTATPNTTRLLLVGPKGSGKSSLVNKVSRLFEPDKFALDRAPISYNPSVGDGTYFLHAYNIPKGSNSFCLYDTRGLSDDPSQNTEIIKKWIREGVSHRALDQRDSDSPTLKERMLDKSTSSPPIQPRKVGFVIFVVNGLSVLKSMESEDEAEKQYNDVLATTFTCPFLSFRDDKAVVVVTHGDLLSLSDRARVRVHLGEILSVPPKQIFDIPESDDGATDLEIADMIRYSLELADRNLPIKEKKNEEVDMISLLCIPIGLLIIVICFAFVNEHTR